MARESETPAFLLAFLGSCGMISGFMDPETQQRGNDSGAPRGSDMYDVLAWLEVNKGKVGIALLLVMLVGFAIATMRYMRQQKELNASTELLSQKITLTPQTNVPPPDPASLLKVAQEYSGTRAGQRAQFLAAAALFQDGKYAEAEAQFARFLQEHSGSPWAAAAAYGRATALEAQEKTNEAMAAYQQIATAYANSAVVDDAKLAMARIYEARNEPEQALRIYNDLAPATPGMRNPGANAEALGRKEALLRLHPQLNTNAPPALAPASLPPAQTNSAQPQQQRTNAAPAADNEPAPDAESQP